MFSKKLSSSVLSICDSGDLSYEAAAELCDLSSRYFGDIARGKTSPTVNTLEKLCNGLNRTPNELLGFPAAGEEFSFRFPRQVIYYRQQLSCNPSFATFRSVRAVIAIWSANTNLSVIAVVRSSAGIAFTMPH